MGSWIAISEKVATYTNSLGARVDSRGVPWIPWIPWIQPLFEGLPSKLLNTMRKRSTYTIYAHTGATYFGFNSSNNDVCRFLFQEFDADLRAHARKYYQKHVATIETVSEAIERIKVYSCIAPSAASDGDMLVYQYEIAYFPAPYPDNQLLCSLCGPKRSHAFNSVGFKHSNQVSQ